MSSSLYVSILYDGYVCISHRLLLLKEQIQQINFNEVLLLDKQKYYRVTIRFSSFHTAGLFLYPPESIRKPLVSDLFKVCENLWLLIFSRCVKREVACNELKLFYSPPLSKWLTLSWRRPISYRNQSIDLRSKMTTLRWKRLVGNNMGQLIQEWTK